MCGILFEGRASANARFKALELGSTFLVVTHDPRIAERCDRVVEIVDGRVRSDRTQSPPKPAGG